jgi:hypothetical protein
MTPAQEREMQDEMLLKQVVDLVGDYMVKMNYAAMGFVHSQHDKHIGVEIIPHPNAVNTKVIQLIH